MQVESTDSHENSNETNSEMSRLMTVDRRVFYDRRIPHFSTYTWHIFDWRYADYSPGMANLRVSKWKRQCMLSIDFKLLAFVRSLPTNRLESNWKVNILRFSNDMAVMLRWEMVTRLSAIFFLLVPPCFSCRPVRFVFFFSPSSHDEHRRKGVSDIKFICLIASSLGLTEAISFARKPCSLNMHDEFSIVSHSDERRTTSHSRVSHRITRETSAVSDFPRELNMISATLISFAEIESRKANRQNLSISRCWISAYY